MPALLALIGLLSSVAVALVYTGQFWPFISWLQRQFRARPPSLIAAFDDPRDIAAILMFVIARKKGDMSERQVQSIRDQMRDALQISDTAEREERLIAARAAAGNISSFSSALADCIPELKRKVGQDELHQLAAMLAAVSAADGPPADEQLQDIEAFKRKAGLVVG